MEKKTKKSQKQGMKQNGSQRIERKYSKDKSKCQITFWLPREFAPEAHCIAVAGSFNGWNQYSHLLNKLGNGEFNLVVEVEAAGSTNSAFSLMRPGGKTPGMRIDTCGLTLGSVKTQ